MLSKVTRLLFIILASQFNLRANTSPLQPAMLKCENIQNPLGMDSYHPRLSWQLTASGKGQFQSAYEIILSDNKSSIDQNKGNLWLSGKVVSIQNKQIGLNEIELKPFTRYYWRVRIYNQDGLISDWSEVAWFETAMLNGKDWQAKWISDGSVQPAKDEDYYKDDPMPLFRKEFSADKKIQSARLYITGLGYYEAYMNGKKIGDHELDPGFTTYGKEILYSVYDITNNLKKGKNVIGVMLGNGWFNPLPLRLFGRIDLRKYQTTGRPCLKAEMHLHFSDGTMQIISTDESWLTAGGPIVRNNVYLGEVYDANKEVPNWNNSGSNSSQWKNATVVSGPAGKLSAQIIPPIRVTSILKPNTITEVGKDTFIVDMGQNFAGVARISVHGVKGARIRLRYGENIYADGRLNYMTTVCTQIKKGILKGGPGAPETAWQQDEYIVRGNGNENWKARFTFHGFRYVEITGWPGKPTLNNIEGMRMNSDLEQVGTFSCSNEMFNNLHRAIQWTFLSNVFSVQSDCPGREKMGYGADMVATADAFMFNYDMSNFYSKAVHDFANEQQVDGGITEMAPYMGIADKGYGGESGPLGWELAFPFLQHKLFEYYGDTSVIRENYSALQKQIQFLQSKSIDGLFHWDISDHEAIDPKPEAFTAAAFYYHHVLLAKQFATLLGKTEDSIKYAKLANGIRSAIIRKYLVTGTGRFDNATQSAQEFALWYRLSPEPEKSFEQLIKELERHEWHTSSGIFGNKMMFDVLREFNRNDIAYRIANQKTYPSWGFMLASGATTLWETWAYPENFPSQNHPMFGSVDEWFYRSILGINNLSPGFDSILIKPQPTEGLTWAKGEYNCPQGMIRSSWTLSGKSFQLQVTIPPNCHVRIELPSSPGSTIKKDGILISDPLFKNGYCILQLFSGNYVLESTVQ